ncbi:hypothetical protein ACLBXM_01835 [Xanthobacteraceae bacterium A53D]
MSGLMEWLVYGLPWWLPVPLLLAGGLVLWRLSGWRAVLAAAVAGALALAHRRGQQAGWTAREQREGRDAQDAVDRAARARRAADAAAADPGGLRDDDGWRRD